MVENKIAEETVVVSSSRTPWENEPDNISFTTNGLACKIIRNRHMQFLCGYVGVPSNHPLFGKHYDDVIDVDVHGGLTYSDMEDNSELWWFGFDCGHYDDYSPGIDSLFHQNGTYRTIDYVKNECSTLAKQLRRMA